MENSWATTEREDGDERKIDKDVMNDAVNKEQKTNKLMLHGQGAKGIVKNILKWMFFHNFWFSPLEECWKLKSFSSGSPRAQF